MNETPLVTTKGLGISFGGTRALDDVSCSFYEGQICALAGANGAGKSTLIKILCGYHASYDGTISLHGGPVRFLDPADAYAKGIRTVHQLIDQGVVQGMSVAENLALDRFFAPGAEFWRNRRKLTDRAREIAAEMDLSFPDMEAKVEDLSSSDRQMIAIARALAARPKLLILDEPTSSLSEREAERLFDTLRTLRSRGVSIVYVSHKLHEIRDLADRVVVLRDGRLCEDLQRPFEVKAIVTAMVGDLGESALTERPRNAVGADSPLLELRDLVFVPGKGPLSLSVRRGEVLGLTGLLGAGQTELVNALLGIARPASGQILLDGEPVTLRGVTDSMKRGIHVVPEDRAKNGIVKSFSVRKNMTLPFLRQLFSGVLGIVRGKKEESATSRMIGAMEIKCAGDRQPIEDLSGGNQQKVVVARWILKDYRVLVLHEPFQGVDIKSRKDIGKHLRENVADSAVMLISSDIDEVIDVADRVLVINNGRIVGEQESHSIDRGRLVHWIAQDSRKA